MGYWGEAMAHNHPIWGDPQDTEAARQVLSEMPAAPAPTAREQAYLDAVRALYGEGEKPERDRAYAAAMEAVHRAYPDDLEAAAFYSLALLGLAYGGASSDAGAPRDPAVLRTRMRAAAVEVFRQAPNHPGAAHYILHAFDDPDHAVLGLPAALAQTPIVFARGLATAMTGAGEVHQLIATLQDVSQQVADAPIPFAANMAPILEIQALEIEAATSASRGQIDEAIATMQQAAMREEAMPVPPRPPPLVKPSHELFGEILLQAGRHEEAAQAFATSLFRQPGRARSVEGAARAAQE
jgi:hypothetical protein